MDEPTNHLDIYAREIMEGAFAEFKGTIIAISHDRYFLNNCVTRILAIEDREINVIEGNYNHYLSLKSSEPMPEIKPAADIKREKYTRHMEIQKQKRLKQAKEGRTRKLAVLETQIESLEDYKEKFEESIGEDTTYEAYQEYQGKIEKLENFYTKWEKLNDKAD